MTSIFEIMTREPSVCLERTSVEECARLMRECDCGEIPVVNNINELRVIGVVTDRDIVVRLIAEGKNPLSCTVEECCTKPAITVSEKTSVDSCLMTMENHQVRRLPVVDSFGRCIGIVSQADLARSAIPAKETGKLVRKVSAPNRAPEPSPIMQ